MKHLLGSLSTFLGVIALLAVGLAGCDAAAPADAPFASADGVVVNPGNGQPNGTCTGFGFATDHVTFVVTNKGKRILTCQFKDLPPTPEVIRVDGFNCNAGGVLTTDSHYRRSPGGNATLRCTA
ncbi:hypothetical protein [Rubrivirga sp. IMCC45206]|uniref:hypothetical protein n=1 Tax=Rubrivirga sp. IMCC45206 TaxID=3391614 RepID=UPI00398FE8EF